MGPVSLRRRSTNPGSPAPSCSQNPPSSSRMRGTTQTDQGWDHDAERHRQRLVHNLGQRPGMPHLSAASTFSLSMCFSRPSIAAATCGLDISSCMAI